MQTITAAAGHGIIKRKLQIVVSQKPVERRPGLTAPAAVAGYAIGLQASRYCAGGFNRLLIEASQLTALVIEALGANRYKMAVGRAALSFHQPIQRSEPSRNHALIPTRRSGQQHRLGQPGVPIGRNILKPFPIRTLYGLIHVQQPSRQCESYALCVPVARVRMEVLLNPQHRVRAGPRTVKTNCCRQREFEQAPGSSSQPMIFRSRQQSSQSPQRPAMRIFRALVFHPVVVVAQEVSESFLLSVKSVLQECQIAESP